MSKVSNHNEIKNAARAIIEENADAILSYMTIEEVELLMLVLYLGNDSNKANAVDIRDGLSVIGYKNGVSVILRSKHVGGKYLDSFAMCGYQDLKEDLTQIALCIQTALIRMEDKL